MKILTGEQNASAGQVLIDGMDVSADTTTVRSQIGYCAQFDALFEIMTVKEHLILYARLRGLTEPAYASQRLIERMQLDRYTNVQARHLSGGNRRKLCFAISVIAAPRVLLLDEPSTGMDASAKRFLWESIAESVKENNCAALLTTHSIEEVEALCSRAGIIIDGQLRCVGTLQHLKSRYGQGYSIEVRVQAPAPALVNATTEKVALGTEFVNDCNALEIYKRLCGFDSKDNVGLNAMRQQALRILHDLNGDSKAGVDVSEYVRRWLQNESCDSVHRFMTRKWKDVALKEQHGLLLNFSMPGQAALLSNLFAALEASKQKLNIAQYAISQASLEEIFNQFAEKQEAKEMQAF